MNQQTFDKFDPALCEMVSVTVLTTSCPVCHKLIQFVDPNHGLHSHEQEADHYRNECVRLHTIIHKLEQTISRTLNPDHPHGTHE